MFKFEPPIPSLYVSKYSFIVYALNNYQSVNYSSIFCVLMFYVRQQPCWQPSVRPSHAGIVSKRLLSSPHDSQFILVLCVTRSSRNSDGVTPCGGAKQRWGVKCRQFSTNNLLSQKWLKIDRYMQRGVLQPLNPLSNRVTFTAIVPGALPGEAKMCIGLSL